MLSAESARMLVLRDGPEFLLSRLQGSEQEPDLSIPPNCEGFGRIRIFKRYKSDWIANPLPLDPAFRALNLPFKDNISVQVFQLAACNANCWYCFVPDGLKEANEVVSRWFSAKQIVDMVEPLIPRIQVLDLSGGNPELVPEWIVETMRELTSRNLHDKIYLWSDDTLTTDFTFSKLTKAQLNYYFEYVNYGKVCCLKGFDSTSFKFNTGLPSSMFDFQINQLQKYIQSPIDIYGYITLTCVTLENVRAKVSRLFDELQKIHPLLPLRIVPLKIVPFSPMQQRKNELQALAMKNQYSVLSEWLEQLSIRYSSLQLKTRMTDIDLRN